MAVTAGGYQPSPWKPIADHVDRYLATDGADGFEWEGAQCVILTTVGRKTGSLRRTPLIRIRDGGRYLLVASMGGAPRHPNWYLNLVDNPEVTIQDQGELHRLREHATATPSEKAELVAPRGKPVARLRRLPVPHCPRPAPRHLRVTQLAA